MKKILITLTILLISSINAAKLSSNKTQYTSTETITINFKELNNQKKDWIGIYHQSATSTRWKNVVKWAWTGDKESGSVSFENLIEGQYYARVFYNNSYETEAELAFEVKKSSTAPIVQLDKETFSSTENIILNFKNMTNHNKDWIAIYPSGASNNFNNVLDWKWTKEKSNGTLIFNPLDEEGTYEIRAFYNNSAAIVYAKTTFTIKDEVRDLFAEAQKQCMGESNSTKNKSTESILCFEDGNAYILDTSDIFYAPLFYADLKQGSKLQEITSIDKPNPVTSRVRFRILKNTELIAIDHSHDSGDLMDQTNFYDHSGKLQFQTNIYQNEVDTTALRGTIKTFENGKKLKITSQEFDLDIDELITYEDIYDISNISETKKISSTKISSISL
ncbi:MAG: No hits [uncultured Sulfurovum sp.]|uniref:No hits n=1 Tax=uncultured Sulfurovum sp. TaxID=269237 RepID=A0A6S6T4E5_9BACT|nr:MAG: No hits [uncultured Sulfurovum sp.]